MAKKGQGIGVEMVQMWTTLLPIARNEGLGRSLTGVSGVREQVFHGDHLECRLMSGFEEHGRGHASFERFTPAGNTDAPAVAGLKSGKPRPGRREIVAALFAEFEELFGHLCANGVRAQVVVTRVATAIAVVSRHRVIGARGKLPSQNIPSFAHSLDGSARERRS
jgi:hypothetical protein